MQSGTWIKVEGSTTPVRSKGKTFSLDELQGFVAGDFERARTRPPRRDMYLNEQGLIDNLPVNKKASLLIDPAYRTGGGVRGDVLVMDPRKRKEKANG